MAMVDATGQRWVGLANYNFKLHYRSGKLNVEADCFQEFLGSGKEHCIPWLLLWIKQ